MKLKLFFTLLLITIIFSSCLLISFQPFYLKKDVVFDEVLVGTWLNKDSLEWTFSKYKQENDFLGVKKVTTPYYNLKYQEEDGGTSYFKVTLFEVNGKYYMDFLPDYKTLEKNAFFSFHTLPVHSLADLQKTSKNEILIRWFNEEWLGELIENKKTDIDHQLIRYGEEDEDGSLTLTASSSELTEFIAKFGDDPNAFDCGDKYSGDDFCVRLMRK